MGSCRAGQDYNECKHTRHQNAVPRHQWHHPGTEAATDGSVLNKTHRRGPAVILTPEGVQNHVPDR